MTPEQMQQKSKAKVQQVLSLMKVLQLSVEPRQKLTQEGFIEHTVYWIDNEHYPTQEATPVTEASSQAAPTTEAPSEHA